MKRIIRCALFITIVALLFSCKKKDDTAPATPTTTPTTTNTFTVEYRVDAPTSEIVAYTYNDANAMPVTLTDTTQFSKGSKTITVDNSKRPFTANLTVDFSNPNPSSRNYTLMVVVNTIIVQVKYVTVPPLAPGGYYREFVQFSIL